MKTNKLFASIFTLSMVIFASASGISNTVKNVTGDNLKKGSNTIESAGKSENSVSTVSADPATDFSYLRFDVNDYISENVTEELPANTFDYLRFDVNNFVNENETVEMELPAANEFDYLRFDVNNFIDANPSEISELPANDFDYLRFDVNKFTSTTEGVFDELPITE